MPTLWKVPSLMALVKEYRETLVALLATMIRAFRSPIKAMKSPMPTEMACFSVMGMALKNGFPDGGQGQDDEDDAFNEYGRQGHFPAVPHLQADGVGKVGVQSHARSQGKGIVGKKLP